MINVKDCHNNPITIAIITNATATIIIVLLFINSPLNISINWSLLLHIVAPYAIYK
jgi:hypothetical protein